MHFVKVKSILSSANGMNLYRGCQHGCIYCDSRSKCYRIEHDFEDVAVKENAIDVLEKTLRRKRKKCMIGTGSMTDPYIPLEEKFCSTRRAMELALKYGFGFTLITKSSRVLRDIDLLKEINSKTKAVVQMTLTTYDDELCKKLEPAASTTRERFEALLTLRDAGIPTVVWLTPLLPFINDTKENLCGIMDYCIQAKVYGILNFGIGLTLREGNREYFYLQLDKKFPGIKEKYIHAYGNSYYCTSPRNSELMRLFHKVCGEHGIVSDHKKIFEYLNEFKKKNEEIQRELF